MSASCQRLASAIRHRLRSTSSQRSLAKRPSSSSDVEPNSLASIVVDESYLRNSSWNDYSDFPAPAQKALKPQKPELQRKRPKRPHALSKVCMILNGGDNKGEKSQKNPHSSEEDMETIIGRLTNMNIAEVASKTSQDEFVKALSEILNTTGNVQDPPQSTKPTRTVKKRVHPMKNSSDNEEEAKQWQPSLLPLPEVQHSLEKGDGNTSKDRIQEPHLSKGKEEESDSVRKKCSKMTSQENIPVADKKPSLGSIHQQKNKPKKTSSSTKLSKTPSLSPNDFKKKMSTHVASDSALTSSDFSVSESDVSVSRSSRTIIVKSRDSSAFERNKEVSSTEISLKSQESKGKRNNTKNKNMINEISSRKSGKELELTVKSGDFSPSQNSLAPKRSLGSQVYPKEQDSESRVNKIKLSQSRLRTSDQSASQTNLKRFVNKLNSQKGSHIYTEVSQSNSNKPASSRKVKKQKSTVVDDADKRQNVPFPQLLATSRSSPSAIWRDIEHILSQATINSKTRISSRNSSKKELNVSSKREKKSSRNARKSTPSKKTKKYKLGRAHSEGNNFIPVRHNRSSPDILTSLLSNVLTKGSGAPEELQRTKASSAKQFQDLQGLKLNDSKVGKKDAEKPSSKASVCSADDASHSSSILKTDSKTTADGRSWPFRLAFSVTQQLFGTKKRLISDSEDSR